MQLKLYIAAFSLLLVFSCRKPFSLPVTGTDQQVVIVEGDIVTGTNVENTFHLSRLRSLSNPDQPAPEVFAKVDIVSANGTRYRLPEVSSGVYSSSLSLDPNTSYQLQVETSSGKQLQSPLSQPMITPPIDSVTFTYNGPERIVRIFVHTHNPAGGSPYYRWTFRETWENDARYESLYDFVNGQIVLRTPAQMIYACYKEDSSHTIILADNSSQSANVISYQPVTVLNGPSDKLYVRYSILVQQYSITKEAYNYWDIQRKNTELTGTLFDPQPSKVPTNLVCTNDPQQQVLGWVSVGNRTEHRIFIRNSQVSGWPFRNEALDCDAVTRGNQASAEFYLANHPDYLPAFYITGGGYGLAPRICVDCRLTGGTLTKPSYW